MKRVRIREPSQCEGFLVSGGISSRIAATLNTAKEAQDIESLLLIFGNRLFHFTNKHKPEGENKNV
jgi:hypothetical protein